MTDDEREAWALYRYRLISPLLDPAASTADRRDFWQYLHDHPPTNPLGHPWVPSTRVVRHYCHLYRTGGFDALQPARRADLGALKAIPSALWDQAVAFKREVPERSAEQVLALLTAWCPTAALDPVAVAHISPSTLYRHWHRAGITRRRLQSAAPKRYRRWEAPAPGALWQSDVMNGPYLLDPTPEDPERKRATYCLVLMDDYSRRIVAGRFVWQADSETLEQLLGEAWQRWGLPQKFYTDNGGIYVSHRLEIVLARLAVRLLHTPPYTPSGKGKQEKLWGFVQSSFLPELRVQPAESLGQLNTWFSAWCEEHYHRRVHGETGETPLRRWGTGGVHRVITWEALHAALRQQVVRTVDKTGQVRWRGLRWIVPEGLLQVKVQLRYTPNHDETVEVWYEDTLYGPAVRADGENPLPAPRGGGPETNPAGPGISYLDVLLDQQAQRRAHGLTYRAQPAPAPSGPEGPTS